MKTKLLHILGWTLALLLVACSTQGPAPTQLAQVQPTQGIVAQAAVVSTTCLNVAPPPGWQGDPLALCFQTIPTSTPTPTNTATSTSTPTATTTNTPSPTDTATATPTLTPAVSVPFVDWHLPGLHLDPITQKPYPIHEHGDKPKPWVYQAAASGQCPAPFSQHREGHVFYKGMYAVSKLGVESYIIVHVASTVAATSHGDHDILYYFRTPVTGVVSCAAGILDFGTPPQLITATADPQTRPIILSKNDGRLPFQDCETWYNRPGQFVFDLGWTVCNRWDRLDGTRSGGNGAHRGADWHVYLDRFPEWPGMDPGLALYAVDDGFGHKRIDFVVNDVQFPDAGVTGPN